MERKINDLSLCYTLFLILLFVSGSLSGMFSDAVYFLAFLAPVALGVYLSREEKISGKELLSISKPDIKFTIPLVFPTVLSVLLLSLLTSLLIKLTTGAENSVDVGNSLIPALLRHALLTAVLEEALFRYLPLCLLSGCSKRNVIILSALFFALVHHSLFSIPYAFFAGVIFMAVDIACNSIIPSFLLHFINNAVSVGMLVYEENTAFAPTAIAILVILSVASILYIFFKKQEYKERIGELFAKAEPIKPTLPLISFAAICLFIALVSIL